MTDEQIERHAMASAGYVIGRQGLTIVDALSRQQWAALGIELTNRSEGSAWALGDWLVYGGKQEGGRWIGSGYEAATLITGYSKTHLSNCYRVADAFPPGIRIPECKFSHHREVLALEDQDQRLQVLRKARTLKWTEMEIREEVKRQQPESPNDSAVILASTYTRRKGKPYTHVNVKCPKCSHVFPVRGHKVKP